MLVTVSRVVLTSRVTSCTRRSSRLGRQEEREGPGGVGVSSENRARAGEKTTVGDATGPSAAVTI